MIPEPGEPNHEVSINETFHVQTDDELTEKELKQIEADDQAIQTILLGLLEDIYAAVDKWSRNVTIVYQTKDLHIADYTQLYDFLKYNQKEVDELNAERLAKTQDPLELMATSNNPYTFSVLHQDQPSFNYNYMQQPIPNPEDIIDPTTAINMELALMAKEFKLNYSTPTNNNQRILLNLHNRQIAQPGMNMGQDRQMQMVGGNGGNQNQVIQNVVQNPRIQNVGNQNGLIGVQGNANQNSNGNADLDKIEEVNANCILMANLQQASTSGTQTNKAPVYDSDGSAEVHNYENCYDNEIFDMFTQEEQYTELLEPIPKPHQSSSAHQELHKIAKDEIFPIVNQVDARVQNFKIQFLKEAAKFFGDFKSLAKESDESLAKHKALELEIKRLLRAVVSQNIISVMQNNSVDETLKLQTELEHTKERFENCIIKKENEYAKLWNDWYKKCEECKFDKISYDKAYNDMQQKIKRLQAQLGDLKGKSKDTSCVSDTLNPLSQKLKNENMELEFQVSDQKDTTRGTSANTKFAKQSILEKPPTVGETHALSKPVTSNSIPTPQGSKVVKNAKVIAPGMFRINSFKPSREEKNVPNKVRASVRTNPITVSQPPVITKKLNNTKNDRAPSASKSSQSKNKEVEVEEHHRKLLLSRNKKHMSSKCNNVKLATQNGKSKVVCAMCKKCLIFVNHDVCLLNYMNGMTSRGKKQKANVSINKHQKKQKPKVKKTKKVGSIERLASPKPSKPRSFFRWSPTGRMFDLKGKIIASSESERQSDCSKGDNACTANPLEPTIKRFLNSTLFLAGQFCDSDLEVAFRRNACFVRNLEGVDLLSGNRTTNLYTINLHEMASASLIYLMAHASSTKSWLWHQRLSYLNFDTINDLAKNDLVSGLPKFKYHKEHLCPLVSKEKAKEHLTYPNQFQNLGRDQKMKHQSVGISHQMSSIRTPQQNEVVEQRNWTLVEAARTMLIFSRAPLFLWAEAIATACFTQNRSIIHRSFNKTPYELINERKLDISFLHVFGALCYPKNDREDIGKLGAKGDIGFFIGYSADSCAFRVYNRRTKKIMETMNVSFDELSAMAFEQRSLKPELQSMTSRQISSGLDLTYAPSTIKTQQPTEGELDLLFEAMYDDYIGGQQSSAQRTVPAAQVHQVRQTLIAGFPPFLPKQAKRNEKPKITICKTGVAKSYPGSFPQRGLNDLSDIKRI
nr:integrase, catalytic region, zinc finger, CCHC-type, peptidase aspartic, catalytic [Tanacetum cinerariifolium]